MKKEYDLISAQHYAAYRPPLHALILKKCLGEKIAFEKGLDIGCGTGQSSIALTKYCEKIIAIEPSAEMLSKQIKNSKVKYQLYNKSKLEFRQSSFDIITFGGSLYYAKSLKLLEEVIRVAKQNAYVLVYDFELNLEEACDILEIDDRLLKSDYNHQENFNDLQTKNGELQLLEQKSEQLSLKINALQLGHLLLSLSPVYEAMIKIHSAKPLHTKISALLKKQFSGKMSAMIFYSIYKCQKSI